MPTSSNKEAPDAHHNLGLLAVARGEIAAALIHFQAALRADPSHGPYWLSCIDALIRAGQPDAARQMLTYGIRSGLRGAAVDALLARLDNSPLAAERPTAPSRRGRRRSKTPPQREERGTIPVEEAARITALFAQGAYADAEPLARALTARFPTHGFGWKALGAVLQRQGRLREALEAKERSAALLPNDAETQNNLGNALLKLNRFPEAEACYRRAVALDPNYPEAWSNLGIALQKIGRLDEAENLCRQALDMRPNYADASSNLGIILQEQGRLREAETAYRAALASNPNHADASNNLGITLQKQGRLLEAEAAHRRAIALQPGDADAWTNLAGCLQQQARPGEAETCYRRAIELNPEQINAVDNLLFCLSHSPAIAPETLFAEHLVFAERFESSLRRGWLPHANSRDAERVLKVGFVSADLRDHAMSYFIEPTLTGLADCPDLALHVYANHVLEDERTERLKAKIPRWNRVVGLSDAALAGKINNDGIDILIDLSGHTGGNRLRVFAQKPAPLQCGWIGYLGTSGMESMDYYLADRCFLPPGGFDRFFTEEIVHLPAVAAFEPSRMAPPVNPLPALDRGCLTFASFSRLGKLSPEVVELWCRLLRELPSARMLIGAMPRDGHYEQVAGWFANEQIAPERLQFHLASTMPDYLRLHQQVDICLDPFPFTGATTTCHAMWMGVPTLTLAGKTVPGRLGPALLHHAGLAEFVASDHDDFVRKGLDCARDLTQLAELRAGMRNRFRQSPLGQPAVVAQGLADAFRVMWRKWCGQSPNSS